MIYVIYDDISKLKLFALDWDSSIDEHNYELQVEVIILDKY